MPGPPGNGLRDRPREPHSLHLQDRIRNVPFDERAGFFSSPRDANSRNSAGQRHVSESDEKFFSLCLIRRPDNCDTAAIIRTVPLTCGDYGHFQIVAANHLVLRKIVGANISTVSRMRCSAKRCTASGIVANSVFVTIPELQRIIPLRFMLRCAQETQTRIKRPAAWWMDC
jgi:hypothetical protein